MMFKRKQLAVKRADLNSPEVDINSGLTEPQIKERQEKNYVNSVKIGTSKSYTAIIAGNVFTFFNFLCTVICVWLITVIEDFNDVKNISFMFIILANTLIGIVQEIRAKKTMDKLSLLSSPDVKVIRCNEEQDIKLNAILKGDIVLLSAGCQVCADSVIRDGEVEVNESLLTGESLPIKKRAGDTLLSGSFIITGSCKCEVVNIAEENYIQKLAMDAKAFKRPESQLIKSLRLIMRVIGFIVLPIGALSFLTNWNTELLKFHDFGAGLFSCIGNLSEFTSAELYSAYKQAVTPTSTALIGVIPSGLFLLTSIALAVGVIRLARQKALVQELYSIETLARVNMLCLDKTGTITDGTMDIKENVDIVEGIDVRDIIASMNAASEDNNMTAEALVKYYGKQGSLEAEFNIPFSSERKCSAVKFKNGKTYIIGAPEFVTERLDDALINRINSYASEGYRCLLLAVNEDDIQEEIIPRNNTPLSIIVIRDNIKSDAVEIISYFKNNGVDVRVISGDNPITVSEVARRVGINNADKYINLYGLSDDEVVAAAMKYTVFGRVSPEQKKLLVKTFKANGNTVAMTGDGINDILALKEADCSIAMANGSEATRNVAQLVLLDSNFASMPKVVGEGRRVINNIERASTLFLTKTALFIVLQFILVFMGTALPLEPIQLSFINLFCIGIPSFFLALEPNNRRIDGSFLLNVAKRVVPSALALIINVTLILVFTVKTDIIAIDDEIINTVVLVSMFTVYLQILFNVCKPFNLNRAILMGAIVTVGMACLLLMPLGAEDGILNLFIVSYIKDVEVIFMIMGLMLLSEYVIKFASMFMSRFEMRGDKLIYDFNLKEKLAEIKTNLKNNS